METVIPILGYDSTMANHGLDMRRHRLASLLEPRSLLVMSDQPLPVLQQAPRTLGQALTVVRLERDQPVVVPDVSANRITGDRLDLAMLCVPPARLAQALDALGPYRPRGALI